MGFFFNLNLKPGTICSHEYKTSTLGDPFTEESHAACSYQVKFSLPSGFRVQRAPENVPPIFVGERTAIYGLLNQNLVGKPELSVEGSISLSGDLLGGKIEHKLNCKIPVPVPRDDRSVTTIHHLAGKRLIKEMESDERWRSRKDEIIKLSCDSKVMSSFTSFIAIDEDLEKPVKGSMEIWDIQAHSFEFFPSSIVLRTRLGAARCAGVQERRLVENVSKAKSFKKQRKGFSLISRKSKGKNKNSAAPTLAKGSSEDKECPPVEKKLPHSFQPVTMEELATIISLQLASGAWCLTTELATVIGKTQGDIKLGCPVPCEGEMETVWATVVVLTYLEEKQPGLKDEWELVAAKAESWLIKQKLPERCSMAWLREKSLYIVR